MDVMFRAQPEVEDRHPRGGPDVRAGLPPPWRSATHR